MSKVIYVIYCTGEIIYDMAFVFSEKMAKLPPAKGN